MELSGPGGRPVKGNRHTPLVRMLRENVIGRPEKWNKKNGEGKIREIDENTGLSKASVYVYHTSLHFSPQQLDIQDKNLLRFNIVECKEYGKIAQFVRVHHPPSSPRQAETPHSPASPRQSEALHPPRTPRKDKTKTTEPSTDLTSDSEDPTLPSLKEECFDPSNIKPNDWGFTGSYEVSQNWGGISHLTLTQTIESPTPLKNDYLYQTYL